MKYFSKYFTARVVLLTLAMLLSSPLVTWAQGTITIKGVVKDAQKEPLAGVSIRVKGTQQGPLLPLPGTTRSRMSHEMLPWSSPTSG